MSDDTRPNFEGHAERECGDHRTVGPHRAWCYDCHEWCYPEGACRGCELPGLRAESERLREALEETARLALKVHDLTDHWSECPAPPDAECDECHDYFAAKAALAASLSETGGEQ